MKISDVTTLFREQVFKGCCQSGGRLVLNSVSCCQASLLVKAGRMSGTEDSEVMEVI